MRKCAVVIRGNVKPILSGRDGMLTLATTLAISQPAITAEAVSIDDMLVRAANG